MFLPQLSCARSARLSCQQHPERIPRRVRWILARGETEAPTRNKGVVEQVRKEATKRSITTVNADCYSVCCVGSLIPSKGGFKAPIKTLVQKARSKRQ